MKNGAKRRWMIGLFNELLNSIFANSGNIGTAVILLLTAQSLQTGVVSLWEILHYLLAILGQITGFGSFLGFVIARYKQAGVAQERMERLCSKAHPLKTLPKKGMCISTHRFPSIPLIKRREGR